MPSMAATSNETLKTILHRFNRCSCCWQVGTGHNTHSYILVPGTVCIVSTRVFE